jgi:23S rRNA (pseudouridine1915-N3)-methyltransferase
MMLDKERMTFMRLTIAAVGENKFGYLREGEADFLKRLKHYCKPNILCVPGFKLTHGASEESVRRREWENLMGCLPEKRYLILLDKRGTMLSSEQLAGKIQNLQNRSVPDVCFTIGGPLGFPHEALSKADFVFSLSPMTFTHEMTRLILLEQLYRAFTILRNEKYHK